MKRILFLLLLCGCSSPSPLKFYSGDIVEIKNGNFGIIQSGGRNFNENYYLVLLGGEPATIYEKDLIYVKSFNWRTGEFVNKVD